MLVDESTSTKGPNIKRFSVGRIIPLRVKNQNVVLPLLINKIKTNNLHNYEKLFISSIINNKKKKSKGNDILKFYHPLLDHICKNEKINSFLSYCYDITKITPPPIKTNRIKINENKYFKKKEKNYRVINIISNRNLHNINSNIGTNTNFLDKEKKPDKKYLSIEDNNNIDERNKYKYIHLIKSKNINESFRNSYFALKKKGNRKNYTLLNDDYCYRNSFRIKNKRSSSLNNSNAHLNNSSTQRAEYKTIKIKNLKSIKRKERIIDKQSFRDSFRIDSKFNY